MTGSHFRAVDYMTVVAGETEETRFLRSAPWILDSIRQSPDALIEALRHEACRLEELPRQPTFSLLTALRDTTPRHLREFILSVRCQSYPNWELLLVDDGSTAWEHLAVARRWANRDPRIRLESLELPRGPSRSRNLAIADSTGDYLIVTEGDGVLHPMALGVIARHINDGPGVNFVFSNEAEIDGDSTGLTNFLVKPAFDLFTLLRIPYAGRLCAIGRELLDAATRGGPAFREEYDGIEEHDLLLRLALTGAVEPRHVPLFAYYRRAGSAGLARLTDEEVRERRRRLTEEAIPRAYPGASWSARVPGDRESLAPTSIWLEDLRGPRPPRLLVIIPFDDRVETTIRCLESIERQVHRLDVLVTLVDNRSIAHATRSLLRDWIARPRASCYEIVDDDRAFGFAGLINAAVARSGGDRDLVLMLSGDVELSTPESLQTMAMQLLADPASGFVGMKLCYPDGRIQHGGVRPDSSSRGSGCPEFVHVGSAEDFVDVERISFGVTFACAMTRVETFEKLGGLDEIFSPDGLIDIEMCLRALDAGYRNYYFGSLSGIHHESVARCPISEDLELGRVHERHGRVFAQWRRRYLHRSDRCAWPYQAPPRGDAASRSPSLLESPGRVPPPPFRYRVADRIHSRLKRGFGPAYPMVLSTITGLIGIRQLVKRPGGVSSLVKKAIKPIPLVGPAGTWAFRRAREFRARASKSRQLIRHLLEHPDQLRFLERAYRARGYQGFREELAIQLPGLRRHFLSAPEWFWQTRPTPRLLAEFRARRWAADAPRITVLMPVYNVREDWLRTAVESVMAQTYPLWELVCVDDASPAPHVREVLDELAGRDSRVRVIHLPTNRGVSAATNRGLAAADGEYVAFMDHDDSLEPHALHRVAEAILQDRPDMLYSDEAITGEDVDRIVHVSARPSFSYDYYLSHPYFTHLIVARTDLARRIGGLDEAMTISQDVDFNLRLIEVCRSVCYIPDVLYRWREHAGSLGHQKMDQCTAMSRGALERHLARIGQAARLDDESYYNFRDIRFQHATPARVAILIPTSNRADLLRACITSLQRTVDPSLADIVVIDQASDQPDVRAYLADRIGKLRVVRYEGPSDSSAVINAGVAAIRGPYTHYLLLSDGTEAIDPGWLEHMLSYGQRGDVGVVGALLLLEDELVHHGGVIVGINGTYDYALRGSPFRSGPSGRCRGHNGSLLASRDVSAVSAACMLTRADVFHGLHGFDERMTVAFNDVDFCIRAWAQGYKTILDAYAVLYHADNRILPYDAAGANSGDIRRFRERYRDLIVGGDPFHSPMLSRLTPETRWSASATCERETRSCTTRVVLPRPTAGCKFRRVDAEEADEIGRRPHLAGRLLPNRESSDLLGVLDA